MISKAENSWTIKQWERLRELNDKKSGNWLGDWHESKSSEIQPICSTDERGNKSYMMFEDEEILETMENRHIKKSKTGPWSSKFKDAVSRKMEAALANLDDAPPLMNNPFIGWSQSYLWEKQRGPRSWPHKCGYDWPCWQRRHGCLSREAVEPGMGSG